MITLVKGKYVIGCENGQHVLYHHGHVAFQDDTIFYVGPNYTGHYDRLIQEEKSLISPGFIDLDSLGDIDHTLVFHEYPRDKGTNLNWSKDYFLHHRAEAMSPEEESFKSLYAYVHLIRSGITTSMPITSVIYKAAGETLQEIESAAHNAGRLGLRVYLGPSYLFAKHVLDENGNLTLMPLPQEEGDLGLQHAEDFIQKFDGAYDGLIRGAVVPERIELQTEESLRKAKALSRKYNCPVRLHAAQGIFEYNHIQKTTELSSIAYLESLDFLDERTLIPHCIITSGSSALEDQSDNDQNLLRETGAHVIHCPLVYSHGGSALESFGRFRRLGVSMTMGTDCFPPDMIENIKVGSILAKSKDHNREENDYKHFFHAATIGGANALGRSDLGRLEKGAKADMLIIDMVDFDLGVQDDPLRTLILSGNSKYIKTSIINGKIVMENRVIPGIDLQALQTEAQKYYEKMKESYKTRSINRNLSHQEFFFSSLEEK